MSERTTSARVSVARLGLGSVGALAGREHPVQPGVDLGVPPGEVAQRVALPSYALLRTTRTGPRRSARLTRARPKRRAVQRRGASPARPGGTQAHSSSQEPGRPLTLSSRFVENAEPRRCLLHSTSGPAMARLSTRASGSLNECFGDARRAVGAERGPESAR